MGPPDDTPAPWLVTSGASWGSGAPDLVLGAGTRVELVNVQIGPLSLRVLPVDPESSLAFSSIQFASDTNKNAPDSQLAVLNSTILLDCPSYNSLQDALCMRNRSPGDAEVYSDFILVADFTVLGMQWHGVTLLPACDATMAAFRSNATCAVRVISQAQGKLLLDSLAFLQAQPVLLPSVVFLINSSTVLLPSGTNLTNVTTNVTILGQSSAVAQPRLDVNLQPLVFQVFIGGSLTLRNLQIVNMVPLPAAYPIGILTCMLWFVDVDSTHAPSQLFVQNSTIMVPQPEMDYLLLAANMSDDVWMSGAAGLFYAPPVCVLGADMNSLVCESTAGRQGTWSGVSVVVPDPSNMFFQKIFWIGLDALLTPGESLAELDLPLVQLAPPLLNLSSFSQQVEAAEAALSALVPYPPLPRFIMSQSVVVDKAAAAAMAQPAALLTDSMVVGDPLHPDTMLLDLAGLSCMPTTVLDDLMMRAPTGYLSIGPPSADPSAPNTTLYLRDLVLVNLSPASCQGVPQLDPMGGPLDLNFYQAMANYTSLLWFFNVYRGSNATSAFNLTSGSMSPIDEPPEQLGRLVMVNVTLVLPPDELRVILQALIGTLKYDINPVALQLMTQELNTMKSLAQQSGQVIRNQRDISVGGTPSLDSLGTVTFPNFSWFGIVGQQVTLTSAKPASMSVPLLVQTVQLWPDTSSPVTVMPALPPDPPSSTPTLQGWSLDLTIAAAVVGGLLLVVGAVFLAQRRWYPLAGKSAKAPSQGSSSEQDPHEGSMDLEAVLPPPIAGSRASLLDNATHTATPRSSVKQPSSLAVVFSLSKASIHHVNEESSDPPGSFSSGSQKGTPSAGGVAAAGAIAAVPATQAHSPFEAVALGLLPLAASRGSAAAAASSGSQAPSTATDLAPASASGRLDTASLMARIFTSTETSAAGPGPGAVRPGGVFASAAANAAAAAMQPSASFSDSDDSDGPAGRDSSRVGARRVARALANCASSTRQEIQRQMDVLRDEVIGPDGADGARPPWEVTGQLGKGAHGVVYRGTWRGLDVAIKRVIFQVLGDPQADAKRKTALREAAINGTLDHPNIVTTYTHDMQPLNATQHQTFADWQLFIIQEYCEGGSLFSAIQDRRFWDAARNQPRMEQVLAIASDIAAGCAYIHSKQIIHGDLKPDNVLLKLRCPATSGQPPSPSEAETTASGSPKAAQGPDSAAALDCTAKVADFGMSIRLAGNNTHVSGVHHGTPLYIAPEILLDGRASTAADLYSFGIIMWELLHGMSAWNQLVRVVGKPCKKNFTAFHPNMFSFDGCALPAYGRLGQACLSENPADRPSFAEVLVALQAIADELAGHAPPLVLLPAQQPWQVRCEPCSPGTASASHTGEAEGNSSSGPALAQGVDLASAASSSASGANSTLDSAVRRADSPPRVLQHVEITIASDGRPPH